MIYPERILQHEMPEATPLPENIKQRLLQRPRGERIVFLLERRHLGKVPLTPSFAERQIRCRASLEETGYGFSNCHGTLLWVISHYEADRPQGVSGYTMIDFLKKYCSEQDSRKANGLWTLWHREALLHSGIYLGPLDDTERVFHQPNTGEPFSLESYGLARALYSSRVWGIEERFFQENTFRVQAA